MYSDADDIFREIDALADHLFARMTQNFKTGMPQMYDHRVIIRNGDDLPAQSEWSDSIPSRAGSEPIPEVHRIENEVMVIAELPGATKESVNLAVVGNELIIDADGGDRHNHTSAALPPVDTGSMQMSFKNGVLEVTFRVAEESY